MREDDQKRLELTEAIKRDLSLGTGTFWKEVQGEPQPAFNEMVFWILVYEDTDLYEVHRKFCEIITPYSDLLKPLEITLAYQLIKDGAVYGHPTLKGNNAGVSALAKDGFGKFNLRISSSSDSVFSSRNSKRNI